MIKNIRYKTSIFLAIISLTACNGSKDNKQNDTQNTQKNTNIELITEEKDVIIEGLYATNTQTPINENSVFNLFDNNASTIWQTPYGSGLNEGIMLYFSTPIELGSVQLVCSSATQHAKVTSVLAYCNSICYKNINEINTKTSTLYLRFDKLHETESIIANGIEQQILATNKNIAVSEIKLFDKSKHQLSIALPRQIDVKIAASSTLQPQSAYSVMNLTDCKKEFAWAEGAEGCGVGQKITFSFNTEVNISSLKIWNGYQRSEAHYTDNARIKSFSFTANGQTGEYSLNDSGLGAQEIKLQTPIKSKEFTLNIKEFYPGKKYNDLAISEIRFYDLQTPILLKTTFEEDKIKTTKQQANTQLSSILDRSIVMQQTDNDEEGDGSYSESISKTLIIRSNNSFVYYRDYTYSEDSGNQNDKSTIADGGWEIIEQGADYSRIRIFGQIYNTSIEQELYVGNTEHSSVKVFQDYITIKNKSLKGDSFIEPIDLQW